MSELIMRLQEAAQAQGLTREAEDDVFELIEAESCSLCCSQSSGGNADNNN
jgi:hypothetical protein